MNEERFPLWAVLGLGVTQVVGYGTLYYSFGILAPDTARDFGLSVEWMFGMLSAALLVGGFTSPWVGRWIDSFGAGRVMAGGSALAALALAICSMSPNRAVFAAALVLTEVSANFVQYGAAFALLVQINPKVAQRSITYLTLIAGFASTIFWPITTALHQHLSWREVYLVFAGLNLAMCVPVHFWLMSSGKKASVGGTASSPFVEGSLSPGQRRRGFVLMVVGFALLSVVSSAILVHMVPLMSSLGLGSMAAIVGTVFGPSQVASRIVNMVFGRSLPPRRLAALAAFLISISLAVLVLTAPTTSGAIAFAILFGFGNGIFSIAAGTLPLSLFGSAGYGRLQGKVMSARLVVGALAPFAFALSMAATGSTVSLAATAVIGGIAVLSFLQIGRARSVR
jgi:predicted MFS family arabinose efflux permease